MDAAIEQLRGLDLPDEAAREYFQKHLPRLARTLTLVPRPRDQRANTRTRLLHANHAIPSTVARIFKRSRRVLWAAGPQLSKIASVRGQQFEFSVDLFDAERDRYPYDDGSFETVLACELIEHLVRDPMHLLLECRRILEDRGRLIVTTPNVASLTSVARVLHGYDNPQISSAYTRGREGAPDEAPHVREYTPFELRTALEAAGFEIESLFTEPIAEFEMNRPMWNFLEENGYNTSMRGEQTYCVAVKRSDLAVTRYPRFLYSD